MQSFRDCRICVLLNRTCSAINSGLDWQENLFEAGYTNVFTLDYHALFLRHGLSQGLYVLTDRLKEQATDIIFIPLDNGYELPVEFLKALQKKYLIFAFIGDDEHYFYRHSVYYGQCFDLVLAGSPLSVPRYQMYRIKSRYYPGSFSLSEYQNIDTISCEDVTFVGALKGKVGRFEYAESLTNSQFDVGLYGIGSPRGSVTREKMLSLFKSSKISLNFTGVSSKCFLDYDQHVNRLLRQVKGRCQQIALSRGFILTEYAPGIEDLFEIGSEIDVFHDKNEMLEKISFYLSNDYLRSSMSERAFLRASLNYTAKIQWPRIFEELGAISAAKDASLRQEPPIVLDNVYLTSFSAYRWSLFLKRIVGGYSFFPVRDFLGCIRNGVPDLFLFMMYTRVMLYPVLKPRLSFLFRSKK